MYLSQDNSSFDNLISQLEDGKKTLSKKSNKTLVAVIFWAEDKYTIKSHQQSVLLTNIDELISEVKTPLESEYTAIIGASGKLMSKSDILLNLDLSAYGSSFVPSKAVAYIKNKQGQHITIIMEEVK